MAEAISAEFITSLNNLAQTNASVLKEISSLTKSLNKILVGPKATAIKSNTVSPEKSATDIALEQKEANPVIINDISSEAYKKLESLFEKITGKETKLEATKTTGGGTGGGGLLSGLIGKSGFGKALSAGLLPALAGLGGSLALAVGSWFNEGPFKGTMKLVGEIGTKVFLPKVTKIITQFFPKLFETFTKSIQGIGKSAGGLITKLLPTTGVLGKLATKFLGFFTPLLKRLPVIGTIINIGSAVSRFMKGDIIGGLIDLGSAVAVLIPGVGTAISLALGLLNAGRDLTGESKKSTGEQVAGIGSLFGKAWDWIKDKFKKLFNYYFGKIGRGIDQIKSGDYIRGIVTLASFIPGLWWMETVYNWLAGPPEEPEKEESEKETLPSDFLGKAWDWIKEKTKNIFTGWFGKLGRGWDQIKSGDYIRGVVTWASFIPGLFWMESLYNWLAGPPEEPEKEESEKEPEQPGIMSKAWGWIKNKVKGVFTGGFGKLGEAWEAIKSGSYLKGLSGLAGMIPGVGWLGSVINWFSKDKEPKQEEPKEESTEQGLFSKIKESITGKTKQIFTKAFGWIGQAWKSIKSGNFLKGVTSLVSSIPGLGWLGGILKWATSTDEVKDETSSITQDEGSGFNWSKIYTSIKDAIKGKLKSVLNMLKKLPFVPDRLVDKMGTFLGIDNTEPATEEAPVAVNTNTNTNVNADVPAQVPLTAIAENTAKNNELLDKISDLIQTIDTKEARVSAGASQNNAVANADNSSINVFNNGGDRDIPYVERNKYRQQLLYVRGIL